MLTEWTEENDATFARAVQYMAEDLDEGYSFEGVLTHISALCGITEAALRHEWNLRKNDVR